MYDKKYDYVIYTDSDYVARTESLEIASLITEALFNHYYMEPQLRITIERQRDEACDKAE